MKYLTAAASITALVIQAGWFVWFLNDHNRNSVPDCNCILSKPLYLFAYAFYSQNKESRTLCFQFSSVAQSCPTLRPHESQHTRPPCPSPTPEVYSNSCPSSRLCHPAASSSVIPFSFCPQSLPALSALFF